MINPDGVRHQIHGNVIQSAKPRPEGEGRIPSDTSVLSKEWGGYPIITFPEVPEIDVLMLDRPNDPRLASENPRPSQVPRQSPTRSMMRRACGFASCP